ncbi:LysR family transcriptional regulator [Enterobacillus tribolii]|uniref:DNA-binding transcriptional LysR family regulator n=1 Tax=Enterobacillus tribolii TaxID=1487935 RepID=A0A370QMK2_9GAMM|nr:LysR family transcriptional regulator [Enterobacillus tribolii]MBW7982437.1 LysR family transcriptional regulator [Enterobacillus tribolii]RDK89603.1 DNA-binding transcriptional LysR family regulator [Enterobacillus tribolii]
MDYSSHNDGLKLLRRFDMNLLTIFEAVYAYKSVSKAAEALGMTSPAVSQSIQRLRGYFPDPLFIRIGKGISPTVYADSLHSNIKSSLIDIIGIFSTKNESNRTLVIWSEPYLGVLLLSSVCELFEQSTNFHCQILHRPLPEKDNGAEEALMYHRADIIFDTKATYSPGIEVENVYSDKMVAVCRTDHPRIKDRLTVDMLQDEKQVFLNRTSMKMASAEQGDSFKGAETAFSTYSLMTSLSVIESTDYVGFFPLTLVNKMQPAFRIRQIECDFELGDYEIYMSYSKKAMQDRLLLMLLNMIRRRLASMNAQER